MSIALDMKIETPHSQQSSVRSSEQNPGSMSAGPLFVVGMWRSGTSLLYALLNQHPQIGLMYESDFPLLSSLFVLPRKSSSWIPKVDSWNGALTRHKIDTASIPDDIVGLPGAFRVVAQQYARKKDATIWGCKSPNYYDCMNQLADWFPNAKFIVIWRDPADVCRSIVRAAKKSPWFARPGMDLRALLGCRRMKEEADQLVRRGAAIHQLQYDDLVQEPVAALTAICDFIGVPFDPRMNSLEGADRSAIYDADHHSMVKSASIVADRQRPEVLSPELKQKIERYIVFWRKQYDGNWPVNAAVSDGTDPASLLERTRDRVRHSLLRSFDLTVPVLYSLVPVAVWQRYRQMKSRYRQVAVKPRGSEAI
jgi:sulfotransferase family protein